MLIFSSYHRTNRMINVLILYVLGSGLLTRWVIHISSRFSLIENILTVTSIVLILQLLTVWTPTLSVFGLGLPKADSYLLNSSRSWVSTILISSLHIRPQLVSCFFLMQNFIRICFDVYLSSFVVSVDKVGSLAYALQNKTLHS